MDYRDEIISAVAKRECARVSRRVIQLLQRTTEGMQSGDGSPLKNLWDEVCVQVQGEESVFWDVYLEVMEQYIAQEVRKLDATAKQAIWLQTNGGMDWECEQEEEDLESILHKEEECVPFADEDITEYVLTRFVLREAANWSNDRIRDYLDPPCAEDDQ